MESTAFNHLLSDREKRVLTLRFGLEDGRSRTLEEAGKEFECTRERIRQIEAKALRKMRQVASSPINGLPDCCHDCDHITAIILTALEHKAL